MFGGWFALIALSFVVYRCAAARHRRRLLWVGILWLLVFGAGIAGSFMMAFVFHLRGIQFATEKEEIEALVVPAGIGMLIGAVLCVWLASRRTNRSSNLVSDG